MSYPKYGLTFEEFQEMNIARQQAAFTLPGHDCSSWTLNDWAVAMTGEVGELCNMLKKARRGDSGESLDPLRLQPDHIIALRKEVADIITYADLLMTKLGGNTAQEIMSKFDEVSKRVGYNAGR